MDLSRVAGERVPMDRLLDLERLGDSSFRATPPASAGDRQFGGLTAGLAVRAAALSLADDGEHETSGGAPAVQHAHCAYLAAISVGSPVRYDVTTLRSGRSSTTVRVDAVQDERLSFSMTATLSRERPTSMPFQRPAPQVADPTSVPPPEEQYEAGSDVLEWVHWYRRSKPIEVRFPEPPVRARVNEHGPTEAVQRVWMRPEAPLPAGYSWRAGAIAYLSDSMFLPVGLAPQGLHLHSEGVLYGTLNHTMWLHEDVDPHDWLLYDMSAEWTGHDRALCTGAMYSREGVRVASFAQEGILARTS